MAAVPFFIYLAPLVVSFVLQPLASLCNVNLRCFISFVRLRDFYLYVYCLYCGLTPCSVDLDNQTTVHFWAPQHRRFHKPALVLIHGFGGNSRWQWEHQLKSLSDAFNVFVPDLVFFGCSVSKSSERSVLFQARSVGEGLKRLGVRKYSVVGLSYGGYVAFRMAEMYEEQIEKVVIMSSGICWSEEEKEEMLRKGGRDVAEILVPERAEDLRILMTRSIYRSPAWKQWIPAFVLQDFIQVMYKDHRKERKEMLKELLLKQPKSYKLPTLNQETLIIWGDKDDVFPLYLGHKLQRHLGEKSRIEVIRDAGHAVQMDDSRRVNHLIKSFVPTSG
ncbi:uncharacterized protein [Aristolochia californica]|uniref:uncharacterized protein n=1 Tax=Aristolochia californica TaxID=171875 RepID=UPI0035DCFF0B